MQQVDTLGSMISIPWDIVVERVNISYVFYPQTSP
jgi:hypothetical protein